MTSTIGIIAGAGHFPLHVAKAAAQQGRHVIGIGLTGWVDASLAQHVAAYEEVSVGQLGRLVERCRAHGVAEAVMAGKVTKEVLFDPSIEFDAAAVAVIGGVKEYSVNALLGGIAQHLAGEGIRLLDSSTFLKHFLCPAGPQTAKHPTPEEDTDIALGVRTASLLADLDVGQTVVVKRRVIVAVEALEGTDAAIQRAGQVGGPGGVVVKMASPSQDMRFDIPVLGLRTVEVARAAGIAVLAVEAGKTLILDPDAVRREADAAGLSIVGVTRAPAASS